MPSLQDDFHFVLAGRDEELPFLVEGERLLVKLELEDLPNSAFAFNHRFGRQSLGDW